MARGRVLAASLAISLFMSALSIPLDARLRRQITNEVESKEISSNSISIQSSSTTEDPFFDDDDMDEPLYTSQTTNGGSSIFSLLNLATALFPSSSSASAILRKIIRQVLIQNRIPFIDRRIDDGNNVIVDSEHGLKPPPFQRQESEEESHEESEENSDSESHSDEENNAAIESFEETKEKEDSHDSKQDTNASDEDYDDDSDEPPEGDGQGGGILGILASLSGGEDGESDLGTLLAAVSGIVVNLSGDGFDLNSIIGSALGLFVGLLSEGAENPGEILASYLLTSLDTITGGGAKNNGAFFGKFLSKLVKGTSAGEEPESEEDNENKPQMSDSGGFLVSLIMSLLGDMSKTSSAGSSQPW